jgi:uncharacterized protein with GYD domain
VAAGRLSFVEVMPRVPTFINLVRFTTEGAKSIGESKKRYELFEQGVKAVGGRVVGSYGVLGDYDLISITELPDEKAAVKVSVAAMTRGTVSIKTLTALPIKEFYSVVDEAVGALAARR